MIIAIAVKDGEFTDAIGEEEGFDNAQIKQIAIDAIMKRINSINNRLIELGVNLSENSL